MKCNSTSKTRIVALILAIVMSLGLTACGGQSAAGTGDSTSVIVDPETGTTTDVPNPDANGKSWLDWGGWSDGGKTDDDNADGNKAGNTTKNDGHVPGTPRECKPMNKNVLRAVTNSYAGGELTTLSMSVKTPSKPDTKNTKMDNSYGTVDWSTAANGYISFTAKGQERCFILEGPNGKQTICTVANGETIKVSLINGTGKYQYAIANNTNNGKSYSIQYKNSFQVKSIDSDLAPYLVSTPYGDYRNAPNAVAKADELWDTNKTRLDNVKAIADWVGDLHYDKKLKMGSLDVYVNPDKVIENGGGVCNEVAKLLVAMLRSQGIPAYAQHGTNARGNGHIWVMAWLETSGTTKNDTTYSTGTWVTIEATGGSLENKSAAEKNCVPSQYAG